MRVHSITIFADKSATPQFDTLTGFEDITLHIHSGKTATRTSPEVTIFFSNVQEAINFKNAIISSWETFLKKKAEEKS